MNVSTKYIQQESYKILKEFHKICEKENLKYILDYGTLLGAVRHGGFIPWDDDLDVAMPREDYEKFLTVAPKYLPDNMEIQNYKTDTKYLVPFTKIRKTDTKVQELELNMYDIKSGVWMDIFVYDFICKDKAMEVKKIKKLEKERKYYKYAFPVIFEKDKSIKRFPKTLAKVIMINLLKIAHKRTDSWLIKKLKNKQLRYLDTAQRYCKERDNKKMRCYKVDNKPDSDENILFFDSFNDRVMAPFETEQFYIPKNYQEVLSTRYGDYLKLPPVEDRKQTHRWTKMINYK